MTGDEGEEAMASRRPASATERTVQLHHRDALTIWARRTANGDLVIEGHDLDAPRFVSPDGEYEYFITVDASRVPDLVVALGGGDGDGDDVLNLLASRADDLVRRGELTWLREAGVEPRYDSYS